ncbi:MAG: AAA family ATPase [Actinobacteria bacterium]|nr:AAA family ATPase [Actinomycetota bacterium]
MTSANESYFGAAETAAQLARIGLAPLEPDTPQIEGTRSLDSYRVRGVEWIDKPFLQRAAFHLLAGRKGTCKGTYVAGLAARVTTGRLQPQPRRVLIVTSEDSIELDFLPRFTAAGGDTRFVTVINDAFKLPEQVEWLEETATLIGNVGLIVIDPLGNHLGGVDTDKEGIVRTAIGPLNALADRLDATILGVRHLGKDASRGALASVLGSTAWVDVPRCVILMARDDEDEMVFHYQVVAGNRGPRSAGRSFRLHLVDVPPAVEITLAIEEGASSKDVEDLLGPRTSAAEPSKSARARELILDILDTEGEQESDALDARLAAETGLAARTVKNVRQKLREEGLVAARPEKDGDGTVTRWLIGRTLAPRNPS